LLNANSTIFSYIMAITS